METFKSCDKRPFLLLVTPMSLGSASGGIFCATTFAFEFSVLQASTELQLADRGTIFLKDLFNKIAARFFFGAGAAYNFDCQKFFCKFGVRMRIAVGSNGSRWRKKGRHSSQFRN